MLLLSCQGFVEPVEPAAGVLKACVGFLSRAASTNAGAGEDGCQLCQEPVKGEHTRGCECVALLLMALLLFQLVQHEVVADDRGDDGERDG